MIFLIIILLVLLSIFDTLIGNGVFKGRHRIIKINNKFYPQRKIRWFFVSYWRYMKSSYSNGVLDDFVKSYEDAVSYSDIGYAKSRLKEDIPSRYRDKTIEKTAEVVFESGVIEAKKQSDFDKAKIMIQEALDKEPNMPLAQKEVLESIINLQ